MEEEAVETKYCSNCQRDIPAANYVMHVTHCQRNLTLCKVCGEPVPTSQQEEHFEEYHAEVKCECGQRLEKMNLEEHKENTCPSRLVECQFCELQLPFSELKSHVDYCGSRTEKCDICDRYIQKKDFKAHEDTGCQYPAKEEKKKMPQKTPIDSYSVMPDGMLHAMGLIESPESYSDVEKLFPFMHGMGEFGQILNTGLGVPPIGGASYFGDVDGTDARFDARDFLPRGARQKPSNPKSNQGDLQDFESADYMQPTSDDEMLAAAYQAGDYDTNGVDEMTSGMIDGPFPIMRSSLMSDPGSDATELPCEFCGNLFPMNLLILHQSGCQLRSYDSFPNVASNGPPVNSHKPSVTGLNNSSVSRHTEFHEYETDLDFDEEREQSALTFLPCEFCQELFPSVNLIAHQAVCDACPASLPPEIVRNGSEFAPLNNTRSPVRKGSKSRPSRPVYESRKEQRRVEDFIPRQLDDSSPDLDFTPEDTGRKSEEYYYDLGERGSTAMNNELQRKPERKASDEGLREFAVLRNNDLVNRQPSVKNRTTDLTRQPKRAVFAPQFNKAAKPTEHGMMIRKKQSTGAKTRPAAVVTRSGRMPQTQAGGRSHLRPQQASLNNVTERVKRDSDTKIAVEIPGKSEARLPSKPLRSDSGISDSTAAVRSTAFQKPKTRDPLPAITPSVVSTANSPSSNPRRNPPTMISETVRPNRGRPRALEGSASESQLSNTRVATSTRKTSTRKKIV